MAKALVAREARRSLRLARMRMTRSRVVHSDGMFDSLLTFERWQSYGQLWRVERYYDLDCHIHLLLGACEWLAFPWLDFFLPVVGGDPRGRPRRSVIMLRIGRLAGHGHSEGL